MVESIKIKNNGQTRETRTDRFRKSNPAFEKKKLYPESGKSLFFFVVIEPM